MMSSGATYGNAVKTPYISVYDEGVKGFGYEPGSNV
jgi:hypothetical protein